MPACNVLQQEDDEINDTQNASASQRKKLSPEDISKLALDVVHYVLTTDQKKYIKRPDIIKHVIMKENGSFFKDIMNEAGNKLLHVSVFFFILPMHRYLRFGFRIYDSEILTFEELRIGVDVIFLSHQTYSMIKAVQLE